MTRLRMLLMGMLVVALTGCGSGGGGSTTDGTTTTGVVAAAATPTPSASDVNPPAGPNAITGTVSVSGASKSSVQVNVALMQARKVVGMRTVSGGGAFSFPSVANGSYQVVVSGAGLRPQSDVFNLVNGSRITATYALSATGSTPTAGEVQGLFAQSMRLMRGLSGIRAIPLAAQGALDFNRRNNFVQSKTKSANVSQASVIAIPVRGALYVAVDRTGTAWVSTNDSVLTNPAATPTSVGVTQISTDGKVVGQLATSASANSGGGVVGVDDALDVGVFNVKLKSFGMLPRGQSNLKEVPVSANSVTTGAIVNQAVPGATSTSRLIFAGSINGSPAMAFMTSAGVATQVTLPAGIPSNFTIFGALTDPGDQTIYLSGNVIGPTGPSHLFHLTADGTSLIEDVNLGAFTLLGNQNLTRDSAGNLWMCSQANLIRVSGAVNNRTVTLIPPKHQDNSAFLTPRGLAADSQGHLWVADQGNNNLTEFDLNGAPLVTLNTGPAPQSVAVDAKDNVWVVCAGGLNNVANAVVDEVVVGGPVPADSTPQTYVAPNGTRVTITPAPTSSSFERVYPQSTYVEHVVVSPMVVTSQSEQTQISSTVVSGPTVTYQSPQYNTSTSEYSVTGTSTDSRSGDTMSYTASFQPTGVGTFNATTGNSSLAVKYFLATGGGGKVAMESTLKQYSNLLGTDQIVTYQITATFASDGSISAFQVTSNASDLGMRGSMSVDGKFLAQIFNVDAPAVQLAGADSGPTLSVLSTLVRMLAQSVPVATPTSQSIATMFQGIAYPPRSPYQPGTVPGYNTLIVTYGDGTTGQTDVPTATTTLPAGSTDPNAATPSTQTVGSTDGTGQTVPANQGPTQAIDTTGGAQGEVAGVCIGGTGFDKGGPIR